MFEKSQMLITWCFISFLFFLTEARYNKNISFFPFGSEEGDESASNLADDVAIGAKIFLSSGLPIFQTYHHLLWIHTNGYISFSSEMTQYKPGSFPYGSSRENSAIVAPLWAKVNTKHTGRVFWRQSRDANLLHQASSQVLAHVPDFTAKWMLIATWQNVGCSECDSHRLNLQQISTSNTFQCVLVSDGSRSFLLFLYQKLEWFKETTPIQIGYDSGDQKHYINFTVKKMRELLFGSNVGRPGLWIFELSHTSLNILLTPTPKSGLTTTPRESTGIATSTLEEPTGTTSSTPGEPTGTATSTPREPIGTISSTSGEPKGTASSTPGEPTGTSTPREPIGTISSTPGELKGTTSSTPGEPTGTSTPREPIGTISSTPGEPIGTYTPREPIGTISSTPGEPKGTTSSTPGEPTGTATSTPGEPTGKGTPILSPTPTMPTPILTPATPPTEVQTPETTLTSTSASSPTPTKLDLDALCNNRGTATVTCLCNDGFEGPRCERESSLTSVLRSTSEPRSSAERSASEGEDLDALCNNHGTAKVTCLCDRGFEGPRCEAEVDWCEAMMDIGRANFTFNFICRGEYGYCTSTPIYGARCICPENRNTLICSMAKKF